MDNALENIRHTDQFLQDESNINGMEPPTAFAYIYDTSLLKNKNY
jgi:hypothetical protein